MNDATPFEKLLSQAADRYLSAPAEAEALALQAVSLLAPDAEPRDRARACRILGTARTYNGAPVRGLADIEAAMEAVPDDDVALRATTERAMSIVLSQLGDLEQSLVWAVRAGASARASGDEALLADALTSVGVARSRAGDATGGLANYEEALRLHEAAGRHQACVSVLNNMGINCKNLGRLDAAIEHLRRAEALSDGDPGVLAMLRVNLADPLLQSGRLDEARTVLDAALNGTDERVHRGFEAYGRVLLGRVLLAQGQTQDARGQLEHAVTQATQNHRPDHLAKAHLALTELHRAQGRFDLALSHHEAYHEAEAARFDEHSAGRLRALQVQFDLAQARHDAEMARLRHGELAEAHRELREMHDALVEADREKSRLMDRLQAQARTDPLTGLANRRHLDERLVDEVERARRLGHPLAVAMCDLDNFKRINDQLGHAMGDDVLRHVAELLRQTCRRIDLVARYGGEEFCIVFIEADDGEAARAAQTLCDVVRAHDWRRLHPALAVTLSIGVAGLAPAVDRPDLLLAEADRHLYDAKRLGKDRVRLAA